MSKRKNTRTMTTARRSTGGLPPRVHSNYCICSPGCIKRHLYFGNPTSCPCDVCVSYALTTKEDTKDTKDDNPEDTKQKQLDERRSEHFRWIEKFCLEHPEWKGCTCPWCHVNSVECACDECTPEMCKKHKSSSSLNFKK